MGKGLLFFVVALLTVPAYAQNVAPGVPPEPEAPAQRLCTIISVDTVSMNFLCQANRQVHQYWIARSSRLQSHGPENSFFNLTAGQRVQVTSHRAGRTEVADTIQL